MTNRVSPKSRALTTNQAATGYKFGGFFHSSSDYDVLPAIGVAQQGGSNQVPAYR